MSALGWRWWPGAYWSHGKAYPIYVPARTREEAFAALRDCYLICRVDAVPL